MENHIKLSITKAAPDPEYNSVFTFTPETDEKLATKLKEAFEIEFLHGERTVLPCGSIQYRLNLSSEAVEAITLAINSVAFKNCQNPN